MSLSEILAEDSLETRIGQRSSQSRQDIGEDACSQVIKHAQAHRHVTATASQLHSWDDEGNPVPFTLNMLNLSALDVRIGENEEK